MPRPMTVATVALAWTAAAPGLGVEPSDVRPICPVRVGAAAESPHPEGRPRIDPVTFFRTLVERYRGLENYADQVRMTQTVIRDGREQRVETEYQCRVDEAGDLDIETPGRQARRTLGLRLPMGAGGSSPLARLKMRYNLWLAPHMALRYSERPLEQFRQGIDDGFTASEASSVTIDDRSMIKVELKSGDGLSEDCEAEFDIYVNSESMLVERIEGEQRLPDGGSIQTTLDIVPVASETEPEYPAAPSAAQEPDAEPQPPAANSPPVGRPASAPRG